jgi:hypothetical protein
MEPEMYTPTIWREHSMTAAQKRDQLNHMETQAAEADSYMAGLAHDFYTIAEADARYLMTAAHPDGPSPAAGVDAAKLDGHTLAEILAMSVPAYCIGMYGGGAMPDGYQEADGTNGTPNYQGYIPRGSGNGVTPGTTGGSNSITPTANAFTTGATTLTDNQIPAHDHTYTDKQNNTAVGGSGGYDRNAWWIQGAYGLDIPRTTLTTEPGNVTVRTAHSHAGSTFAWTGYKDSAGTSQAGALDIRPACRAVKFIMRLP